MTIEQVREASRSELGSAGVAGDKKDAAAFGSCLFIWVEDGKTLIVEN
jgi:hypothetical protein